MRFIPRLDHASGNWGVFDTAQGFMLAAVRYPTQEQADSFADRLNAINEGEPPSVIEDLRTDSDRLR